MFVSSPFEFLTILSINKLVYVVNESNENIMYISIKSIDSIDRIVYNVYRNRISIILKSLLESSWGGGDNVDCLHSSYAVVSLVFLSS